MTFGGRYPNPYIYMSNPHEDKFLYDNPSINNILKLYHPCQICGQLTTLCCSKCHKIYYCSRQCQSNDWHEHKKICKENIGFS